MARAQREFKRKDGRRIWMEMSGGLLQEKTGESLWVVIAVSERKLAESELRKDATEKIRQLAFYDSLTHLPNRRLLIDRLRQALASSTRSGRAGALLFLDLDNFKDLNDTRGHDIGDRLLTEAARRIGDSVRKGDTAARLGGDEFVVMLEDLSSEAQEAAVQTGHLSEKIRLALQRKQLCLHYQPQIDSLRHFIGAEALLRWMHREHGQIPPGEFIPLAEETGLILSIGRWVLTTACAQIATWSAQPACRDLRLAVNISARQFRKPDFVAEVIAVLAQTGADPTRLKLELTESLALDDVGCTLAKMHALKSLGISFSLDDFGTGNSSLSYLTKLPLDQLKIDRSLIVNLSSNRNDAVIAQTIITMAMSLELDVIAEGVETEAQRKFLAHHGCHVFQGYLFSRPLPLVEFEQFLTKSQARRISSVH